MNKDIGNKLGISAYQAGVAFNYFCETLRQITTVTTTFDERIKHIDEILREKELGLAELYPIY